MTMISATPSPSSASVALKTTYPGTNRGTVWRYVDGVATEVRGFKLANGQEIPPEIDYEAPLGVPLGYSCVLWTTTPPVAPDFPQVTTQLNVPDNEGWMKFPAYPERNFKMGCVTRLPKRDFASNSGIFRIIGRRKPVAIHDVMSWWTGEIEWLAPTRLDHDEQVDMISSGSIMLLQTMPAYGGIHEYISPDKLSTEHAGVATTDHPERLMSLSFDSIDEPVGSYSIDILYTYDEVEADWATYNAVKAGYRTYYDLLRDRRI